MGLLDRVANRALTRAPQERASVEAATSNVSYYSPHQVTLPAWDASHAISNHYNANTYIHSAVNRIADDIAALPFRAGPNPEVPKNYNARAPLAKFLGPPPQGPNPMWSARQLWTWSIRQYLVTGRFSWLLETDPASGQISGVWPLASQYLYPIRTQGGAGYFESFEYRPPTVHKPIVLAASDVVYVYNPSAEDPKEPESVLKAAARNVAVATAIDEFEHSFYRNNAVPSHIVVTPSFAEPESRRAWQDQWRAEYGGPRNAGKAMFLETGYGDEYGDTAPSAKDQVMVTQLGTNAEDAQTTAARDSHIQDISVALGVPLSVLGDSTHSKFQNADMDERNYWRHTVLPRANEICDQINIQLAPRLGKDLGFFDFSSVAALNPDKTIKPTDPIIHVLAGLISPDEARGMMGLGSIADVFPPGHQIVVPAGLAGVTATPGVPIEDSAVKPVLPSSETPPDPTEVEATPTRLALVEARHAGHEHLPIPSGHLHEESKPEHKIKAWETMLTQQLQALMEEQEAHVLGRLSGRKGKRGANADAVFDQAYWLSRTENLLAPIFRALELGDSTPTSEALVEDVATGLDLLLMAQRDSEAVKTELHSLWAGRAESLSESILGPLKPSHLSFDDAQSLFTRLSAGELSISAALAALEGAA